MSLILPIVRFDVIHVLTLLDDGGCFAALLWDADSLSLVDYTRPLTPRWTVECSTKPKCGWLLGTNIALQFPRWIAIYSMDTGTELSTMALCATHEVIHCRGDSDAHNELMILETEDTRWRLSIQTSETLRNFAWSQSHPTAQSTFYMVERHDTHCMVTNTDTWYSVNCTTGEVTQCPRAVPSYLYDSRTTNVFTPADGYVVANGSIFYDGALLWNDALFQVRQIIAFEQDVMVTVGFYACQTTLVVLHIDPNTRHVVVRHHAEISRPDALIVGDKTVVYETKAGPQCYHWIKNRTVAIDTANARRMFFPTNTKTHLGLRYAQHITLIPLEIDA